MKKSSTKETIAARIPVSEMVVDEYQGHVNQRLVDKIAAEWDDAAAGAVILNMRDNDVYAVLDGQHRVLAAQKIFVTELNALVFVGKTREEEAKLFVQLNTKHNVRPLDKFKANLFSGSVREKNINRAVVELGLAVRDYKDPKCVRSVLCLTEMYDNHGLAHLKAVLGSLQAAFGHYSDTLAYSDPAIRSMSAFIYRYPEASIVRLIDKLKNYTPTTIHGMAIQRKDPGQSAWMGWGKVFTGIYNSGFKSSSSKFLPMNRWDRLTYTPKGKAANAEKGRRVLVQYRQRKSDMLAAAKTVVK